jgi:hypothetical protein
VTISSSPIIRARAVPARRQEDVDPAAPPAEAAERVVIARDVDRDPADRRRRHRDYGDPDYGYPDPEPTGRSRRADTDPEPTGRSRRADTGPELTAPSRRAEPAPSGSMVTPTAKAATTPATAPLTASTPAEGPAASTLPPPIPSARVVDDWTPAERSTAHRGQRVVPEPLEWGDQPASPEITATHIKASIAAERAEAHTDEDEMVLTDEDRTVGEKRRRFFRRRRS